MRIYELAKEYNITSKDVKNILDNLGITYKTHTSAIPEEHIKNVVAKISKKSVKTKKTTSKKEPAKSKTAEKKKKETTTKKKLDKKAPKESKEKKTDKIKKKISDQGSKEKKKATNSEIKEDKLKSKDSLENIENDEKYSEDLYYKTTAGSKNKKTKKTKDAVKSSIHMPTETEIQPIAEEIITASNVTVKEFAETAGIEPSIIIKKLFLLGVVANINHVLDKDSLLIVADELKLKIQIKEEEDKTPESIVIEEEEDTEELLESRPPVVTVMGHVNHGKTTLLDAIRKTTVADSESGGITQHIGAYLVKHHDSEICFIDTPGHAAFSSMRSMGANVTDIVILVVAANDGIQPQTLESISHAKEAEVPIIIAINKTDIDGISVDQIKGELSQNGLTPEDWGGDNLCVNISALKGQGIEELLDSINLQAELLELKANPNGKPFGIILESCQTENKGPLVTVLVKNGTFKIGDPILCGHVYGKIRRMENELGYSIKEAKPSYPVRIFGFSEVPDISAQVKVISDEKQAKEKAKKAKNSLRNKQLKRKESITLDNIYSSLQAEAKKEFKIIIKADVLGSIDAIKSLLDAISSEKINLKIIHSATGTVSDNDVTFASAYSALIFAYRTKISGSAVNLSKQHGVSIRQYEVIYHVFDDVKKAMEGLLDSEFIENEIGKATVKKIFKIGKLGHIAGCLVTEGKVTRNAICKVLRNGTELEMNENISSLKHYKDEVNEIRMGVECGIALENFNEFQEEDVLVFFEKVKTLSKL